MSKIVKLALVVLLILFVNNKGYCLNLDKVKAYLLSGDYKAAILEGEKLLAQDGRSDELYYILGLGYLKDGNYLRASDIFEIILREFKESSYKEEARLGLGDTYFLRGDFDRAKENYKGLLESIPQGKLKAQVYYRLSQVGFKTGDAQAGKEYLDKLKQEFPLNPELKQNKDLYAMPVSSSEFYYTVQVGAFSSKTNADNLMQRLIQKGYPAYIEEINSQDPASYRVRVGKLHMRNEAEDLKNRLSGEGYPTKIYP